MTENTARKRYKTFAEFYPFYLSEHSDRTCRRLHFFGTSFALLCLIMFAMTWQFAWLISTLLVGYGFAWIGHFVFEKNQPASFKQPLFSFLGDYKMWFEILTGKILF
jgi:hypothetical protein